MYYTYIRAKRGGRGPPAVTPTSAKQTPVPLAPVFDEFTPPPVIELVVYNMTCLV